MSLYLNDELGERLEVTAKEKGSDYYQRSTSNSEQLLLVHWKQKTVRLEI